MLFNEFYFVKKHDKNSIQKGFGNGVRKIRITKGLTQEQLANELNVEVSQISRIERGVINTSVVMLYQLSSILAVNISEFFEFE